MERKEKRFLRARNAKIELDGKKIVLKGVNLGGWLMMEGYILHAPNIAEQVFKKDFAAKLGATALMEFENAFRTNFIREQDFQRIALLGFNCLRVPFNCRLVEKAPYVYDASGVRYLDDVIRWAEKYKLWIILDLHAAPGAQNHDWHSDSLGKAELWQKKIYQERTFALWEFLADRYKDKTAVAGYDLLNESVLEDTKLLNRFYKQLIARVRAIDKNHIFFVEGNKWAMDLDCLDDFLDDNLALSIHFYHPLDSTFNLVPQLTYPLKGFDKNTIRKMIRVYHNISRKRNRPVLVGEFGVNARGGLYGEDVWVKDVLACFKEAGFSWTYWTYKAVKNSVFPDGIFSYRGNPLWVNRQGPKTGWENFASCWRMKQKEMVCSWRTQQFSENKEIISALRRNS